MSSPCQKCSHSYECLNCGVNFGDCTMKQAEDKMRDENYSYKMCNDGWVLQLDNITHKIEIIEPISKVKVINYKKRNINLRRD